MSSLLCLKKKCIFLLGMNILSRNVNHSFYFFTFALNQGHFMARPVFNPEQSLVGEIIHSLERFNPRFAWIQFLFAQRDCNHLLMHTKAELENYVQFANTPNYDERSRQRIPRKEMNSQWYKFALPRIKKIEQILSKPTVVFAINGMWVASEGNPGNSIHQIQELPFSLCADETDRLRAFLYSDPRMLRMLVERRMVTDISSSVYRYSRSREEPPSLIFAPDEIPYYVHMPTGPSAKGLTSSKLAAHFPVGGALKAANVKPPNFSDAIKVPKADDIMQHPIENSSALPSSQAQGLQEVRKVTGGVRDQTPETGRKGPAVAVLKKIPTLEQPLEEDEAKRLSQIVSRNIRSFELIYDSKGAVDEHFEPKAVTQMVLSSSCETNANDLQSVYIPELESIYGKLNYELVSDRRPAFVRNEFADVVFCQELGP